MKRLIVSALFVSVICIGISGLIRTASASLGTDVKAVDLIRAARLAIGGDQNITEVRSMTIKGATTHFFEKEGVQVVKQGGVEINFELPGKFSKLVKIGEPGTGNTEEIIGNDVDIVVERIDGDVPANLDNKENVFIVRKGGGEDVEWVTDGNDKVKAADGKVSVKKPDGTVEEIKTDGKHRIVLHKDGSNAEADGDVNEWVTDDGKRVRVERDMAFGKHMGSNEMLRTTMALLLTAPNDGSVTYKFAGVGNVDGFASNIIEVGSMGSSFKLYLDAATNLPQMVSYSTHGHHVIRFDGDKKVTQERYVDMKPREKAKLIEKQIKFSDFRDVGGLLLPHRWTETSDGKSTQDIDITGYEINPANIAGKFEGEGGKMIIKKRMQKN